MKGLPNRRGKKENSIIEEIYLYIYIYKTENKKPQYISPLTLLLFSFSKDKLNWKTINPVSLVLSQTQHSNGNIHLQEAIVLYQSFSLQNTQSQYSCECCGPLKYSRKCRSQHKIAFSGFVCDVCYCTILIFDMLCGSIFGSLAIVLTSTITNW